MRALLGEGSHWNWSASLLEQNVGAGSFSPANEQRTLTGNERTECSRFVGQPTQGGNQRSQSSLGWKMGERGFDVNRSQVSEDQLAKFLAEDVHEDITSVPGIGPAAAKKLAEQVEGDSPIQTTYQLIGKFLSLRGPGMSTQEHCDAFWNYLSLRGVNSHRSGIVHAIAEKTDLAFPGTLRR